jgi:serralysin
MLGGAGGNRLFGEEGADTLNGGAGNDTLTGGGGADAFILANAPGAANEDLITDFTSGVDKLRLDGSVMTALGGSGNFSAGDARFFAGAGASSGQDASDRVIYNTSTQELFYDADGSGGGASLLIARLQNPSGPVVLQATDIAVDNGSVAPPPPPPGVSIFSGSGNDSLTGTAGNDTINGGGGNDSIAGGAGNDSVSGSGGQDTFVFREAGTANADRVTDFASNWDRFFLDNAGLTALGAEGRFVSGDARFWAAAGANAGHDANDRVVYNTTTGQLWYDADGSGAGAAELLATLTNLGNVVATDITVI